MNTNSLINQKKYIDLDSSYRNRKLYRNPCDFVVDINAPNRDTPSSALDPILLAFPYEANLTSALSTPTQIPLSVNSSGIRNFYKGSFIEINGIFRLITYYDELTQVVTVSPAFPAVYFALTNYTIRKQEPFEGPDLTSAIAPNNTSIVLDITASSIDNFYVNFYVFLPGIVPPSSYQYARILSYDGTTKVATVATPFTSIVGAAVTYEILEFTKDNVVPLRFNGNQVIGNPSPYQIELTNLIVPNRYVLNGYGGTLSDYSHIYVSLYSANATTSTNAIFSNNNSSLQALFKVPISSLYLQANQQFYNFQFTNMSQTISFRENDSLHFTVSLPNGNILEFEPINKDTYFQDYIGQFPIESDPLEQVTSLFEIIKLPQTTVLKQSGTGGNNQAIIDLESVDNRISENVNMLEGGTSVNTGATISKNIGTTPTKFILTQTDANSKGFYIPENVSLITEEGKIFDGNQARTIDNKTLH